MKHLRIALGLVVLLGSCLAAAQTALTATTLSAAVTTSSTTTVRVASATGITANNTMLYVDYEAMYVNSVSGTAVSVTRGYHGTKSFPHISGAMVLAGPPNAFINYDLNGRACTAGSNEFAYTPVVNITNGNQWLCSTISLKAIPGFVTNITGSGVNTLVASAAGLITPSGPLFHVNGTAAITGFNIPVGFDPKGGATICAIPDAIWTTTAANNIALASTAVVNRVLCWTYEPATAKFIPSY